MGGRLGIQFEGGRGLLYAVPSRLEVKSLDAVITGAISVCCQPTIAIFNPRSTYSYVSAYCCNNSKLPLVIAQCLESLVTLRKLMA